jgi:type II restriction enzyme
MLKLGENVASNHPKIYVPLIIFRVSLRKRAKARKFLKTSIITESQLKKREFWIEKISHLNGNFGIDSDTIEQEISDEIKTEGIDTLLGHLRLCGAIPEIYGHDSSEEKLYSKYTDIIIHEAYLSLGLNSRVLKERSGFADVECFTDNYSFVADAKAFRLSRTAKNQKDFKVSAMNDWKHGKPYAMVVCPIYQLPSRQSQIYQQARTLSVCIGTYSHLAVLVRFANKKGCKQAIDLLHKIFQSIKSEHPTKNANDYWQIVNRTMIHFDNSIKNILKYETRASLESVEICSKESLSFLKKETEQIKKLSREAAIEEVLKSRKITNKIRAINSACDNGLLSIT